MRSLQRKILPRKFYVENSKYCKLQNYSNFTKAMEAMNKKLDLVLNKLEKIESLLDLFEKNLAKNTKKIKAIDSCCDDVEKLMQNTVTLTKFKALEERIEQLEAALKSKNNHINNVSDNMKTFNRCLNKFQKRTAQELLEKKIYDKRFHLVIHDIEVGTESAWETKWESETKFKQFLQNG